MDFESKNRYEFTVTATNLIAQANGAKKNSATAKVIASVENVNEAPEFAEELFEFAGKVKNWLCHKCRSHVPCIFSALGSNQVESAIFIFHWSYIDVDQHVSLAKL